MCNSCLPFSDTKLSSSKPPSDINGHPGSYDRGKRASKRKKVAQWPGSGSAGTDYTLIPSERAFRERERRRVEGILVDRAILAALDAH